MNPIRIRVFEYINYNDLSIVEMQLVVKVLEDKSTLFQIEKIAPDSLNVLRAPVVQLISMFAVQPSRDILDASKNLHRVVSIHSP